jgi:hypothetical protein
MGTSTVTFCDLCKGTTDVSVMTVVFSRKAWEVDICQGCYGKGFSALIKSARRAERSTVKPQHRFKVTEIDKSNL